MLLIATTATYAADPTKKPPFNNSNCKIADYELQPGDSFSWTGICKKGLLEGAGTFLLQQNAKLALTYDGPFSAGKRTGVGVAIWSNGDQYAGDFLDGKLTGKGIYIRSSGSRYEGLLIEGQRNGKGIFTTPEGDRYEGEFFNEKLQG